MQAMSLNSELRDKWLKALRSGEYKQGTNYLRDTDNEFCALGVFLNVIDDSRWVKTGPIYAYSYCGVTGVQNFPHNLRPIVGLSTDLACKLMGKNDQDKLSFAEIADFIEEETVRQRVHG